MDTLKDTKWNAWCPFAIVTAVRTFDRGSSGFSLQWAWNAYHNKQKTRTGRIQQYP